MIYTIDLIRKSIKDLDENATLVLPKNLTPCKRKLSTLISEDFYTPIFDSFVKTVSKSNYLIVLRAFIDDKFIRFLLSKIEHNKTENILKLFLAFNSCVKRFKALVQECDKLLSFEQLFTLHNILHIEIMNVLKKAHPIYMKLYFGLKSNTPNTLTIKN